MKYHAIIWDVDGTLTCSAPIVYQSLQDAFEELGHPERYPAARKLAMQCPSETLLTEVGFEDVPAALACWNRHYTALTGSDLYNFFPGTREAVLRLKELGVPQAIVTSRTRVEVDGDRLLAGLRDCFRVIVNGDDTREHKPDPRPALRCLELLGYPPEEVLYIGDTVADVGCARAAGIDFLPAMWNETLDARVKAPEAYTPEHIVSLFMEKTDK